MQQVTKAALLSTNPRFSQVFEPNYGVPVVVAPKVTRVTCNNPSAFTFFGTNSYLVGTDTLAVIDPGPLDETHLAALINAVGARPVSHIFVSHTHADHSPLAKKLKELTGAMIVGAGVHRSARPLNIGEVNPLDAAADHGHVPDTELTEGQIVDGDGWTIKAIETPGHCANHLAFELVGEETLFSADHVMAWATSIVAPPDGAMADYMGSLDKLEGLGHQRYFPGHGGPVENPDAFLRGLRGHRKMRERAILERISKGDRTIVSMVANIYRDTDPRLHGAAALSVLAHLEDLVARNAVRTEGPPSLQGTFEPV
ncbi:MAG: MBL fold metallo-hydrolase [Pseudomonadota bacterium]